MAFNKHGETKIATVLMWVLIVGAIAYVANFGGFKDTINGFIGTQPAAPAIPATPSSETLTDTKDCPTDGTTTFTMNVQDALATTATSLYPEYYVFNGNQLIKEGTLSSTASTVSLSCGKDYDVLLVNTTAGSDSAYYATVLNLKARIAQQTVNAKQTKAGSAFVYKVFNQVEGASSTYYANMTLGAATTKNWGIQFGANWTAKGYNRPLIICSVNSTEILTLTLSSFDDGSKPVTASIPKRISTSTGRQNYAWEYPKMHDMTQPIVTGLGSITSTTTGPMAAFTSNMTCILADQGTWKIAQYKSAGSIDEGFKTGAENTETLADVGGADATFNTMVFLNSRGL